MNYEDGRDRLRKEREWVVQGNPKGLKRHLARGKQHVSERIQQMIDKDSWLEYGEFSRAISDDLKDRSPRDGVMTGLAQIDGQRVAIIGDDITVLGATQSSVSVRKVDRIIDIALRNNFPIISLSEGGGVRLPDGIGVGFTRLCGMHPVKSLGSLANWSRRPLFICGVFGHCYGDPAFRVGMADISIMVEDAGAAVSSPSVIEAAISEKVSDRDLGGPGLHQSTTGTVDIVVKKEEECIQAIKRVLRVMRHNEISTDPPDRLVAELESIVPSDNKKVYDMRKVIDLIVDNREWLELKSKFGKGLLIGLARIGGRCVGVIASQPLSAGGSVDAKALRKSAAFMEFAIKRRIPLLVLQDLPGFLIGTAVEKDGMLDAVANHARVLDAVDVPMITIIIRKAYGAAYYFLGMGASGAQYVAAWSNAEISFISPDIGAAILTKNVEQDQKSEARKAMAKNLSKGASIWDAAYEHWLDAVITPEETRKTVCQAFNYIGGVTSPSKL
jgi:acetyl-CoA carboxylase carboxyltransferase component